MSLLQRVISQQNKRKILMKIGAAKNFLIRARSKGREEVGNLMNK